MTQHTVPVDFPICLRLAGRKVLLVGGGGIALSRAHALLKAGAELTVIATRTGDAMRELARAGRLRLFERSWAPGDTHGYALVLSAIDDVAVSRSIAAEARAANILVSCADIPDLCDFTIPAVGTRGPITIAVSTGGQAPAVAGELRTRILAALGREPVWAARLSGWLRRRLEAGAPRRDLLRQLRAYDDFARDRRRETFAKLRRDLESMEQV